MKGSELVRLFREAGWELLRIESSHHILCLGSDRISIPVHKGKDLGKGLQERLLKRLRRAGDEGSIPGQNHP